MTPSAPLQPDLDAAARWCLARGERLTPQRGEVLALLLAQAGPMKAYELLAEIQKRKPTAAPPTVYRALDFLVSVGLVHRLGSLNAFIACRHHDHDHHGVMLICDDCHSVTELSAAPITSMLALEAAAVGFTVAAQDVELHGRCAGCQNATSEPAA
jgi:Fur family zinc uptake transcriptional regulator